MRMFRLRRVLVRVAAMAALGVAALPALVSGSMAAGVPWLQQRAAKALPADDKRLVFSVAEKSLLKQRLRRRAPASSRHGDGGDTPSHPGRSKPEHAKPDHASDPAKAPKTRSVRARDPNGPKCTGGRIVDGACHCSGGARASDGVCVATNPHPGHLPPPSLVQPVLVLPTPPSLGPAPLPSARMPHVLPTLPPAVLPPAGGTSPPLAPLPIIDANAQFVPDEVLAVLPAAAALSVEADAALRFNLVLVERVALPLLDLRIVRFRIPDARSVATVTAALAGDAAIGVAQPNFVYRPQQAPAASPALSIQYAVEKVDLAAARALAIGRGTTVAVIDTGIDTGHDDLRGSDIQTFDTTGAEPSAPDAHGTAIAGIIAARGMLEGVAPAARIVGIRAFAPARPGAPPYATSVMVLKAMDLAIAQHAQVMNLSFAGAADPLMQKAVTAAARRGAIMVAAAGNNGHTAAPCYPAAYPDVIAVTAVDADDHLYGQANVGDYVAVAAPGVDILVASPGNNRELQSGTSFAAAHVTGIVALLLERDPGLSPARARVALTGGAVDLGTHGPDAEFGAGRVNAAASLRLLPTSP